MQDSPAQFNGLAAKCLAEWRFVSLGIGRRGDKEVAWADGVPGHHGVLNLAPYTSIHDEVRRLWMLLDANHGSATAPEDFVVTHDGVTYRGHRNIGVDHTAMFVLRRIPNSVPHILPLPEEHPDHGRNPINFNPHIGRQLVEAAEGPGLVLIAGPPGQGKTATATGLFVDSLERYGGVGVAVEDPPEYNLNGPRGANAWCIQMDCSEHDHLSGDPYTQRIRGAFRNSARRALIGEIRSPRDAQPVLHAASGAFAVVSTMHANDIATAVMRLHSLLAEDEGSDGAAAMLAASLKMVVFQLLRNRNPIVKILSIEDAERTMLQRLDWAGLENASNEQMNRLRNSLSALARPRPGAA